ncbi:MAG TPA: DnaJ family domain-containing protein [Casimicrobiaceae bacterium]|nr:DnaJ family domain-containing protein [Casimicrobiaceae bacterium]
MSALLLLDELAEARIEEAIAAGAFDDLPGAGRPLELDEDRFVPEELRAAYRVLKRAGFVPPEVEARKEISSLVTLIGTLDEGPERRHALAKLAFIQARLDVRGSGLGRMRRRRAAW